MDDFDDVGTGFPNDTRNIGKLTGRVVNLERQACDAAITHQPAQDQGRQQTTVDITATNHEAYFFAAIRIQIIFDHRQPSPRRTFGHQFLRRQ